MTIVDARCPYPSLGRSNDLVARVRRAATVAALVILGDTQGLDGVDIDIEGQLLTEIDRAGDYTPFIAALSDAMKARGKLFTCATASYEGGLIPVTSFPYFDLVIVMRSEESTSELPSLMRISHAVFCCIKKNKQQYLTYNKQ